ncbi:MAG: hypothetical protein NXY59_08250 [Aigarchaeota archaeon]|nr:hypothetical protein [Candidatus Pelearchaeum maunauluense]
MPEDAITTLIVFLALLILIITALILIKRERKTRKKQEDNIALLEPWMDAYALLHRRVMQGKLGEAAKIASSIIKQDKHGGNLSRMLENLPPTARDTLRSFVEEAGRKRR